MIYITGDTHGNFERISVFCNRMNTTTEDVMIILGDAGINYYGHVRDQIRKEEISKLPIGLRRITCLRMIISTFPTMDR